MTAIAIVAGAGALPRLITRSLKASNRDYVIVHFQGVDGLDWTADHPKIAARFERPGDLFDAMHHHQVSEVVFAGAMNRPPLEQASFDGTLLRYAPKLLPAMGRGDDAVLSIVVEMFLDAGFDVCRADQVVPDLAAISGVLTSTSPSDQDLRDLSRARKIVQTLGSLDIGQGAVVAQGLCLATEALPGTDAMLAHVAGIDRTRLPRKDGAKGVLFKGPKPGQDFRIDLPAIGPATVELVTQAGMAGIGVEAGGTLILERARTIERAEAAGIFIIALDPDRA